ncbi:MAG: M16 family metallopeptidase [Phycisphaerales bacterium JB065]
MIHACSLLSIALLIPTLISTGVAGEPVSVQQIASEPQDILPLPTDPNMVSGTLSNGLRFAILPVSSDGDEADSSVAFVLQIGAGSAFEKDDQIGVARLAAELASSGAFASDRVSFEKAIAGLELDPAEAVRSSTGYTTTRFTIEVPVGAEGGLSSADIARAIELLGSLIDGGATGVNEQRVAEARAVLLARQTAWSGPSQRITARALPELFGDSIYGHRVPIYDRETLERTEAGAVGSFVESWYASRHATLVVVGPVDREVVRRIIEKSLGPLGSGPASDMPDLSVPTPEQGRVLVESDAGIAGDVVQLMLIQDPAPPTRCAATLQERLAERVATQALSRRLEELARSSDAATLQGGAFSNADAGGYRMSMLNVAGSPGEWDRLTREAVASLNSVQELGFTRREIEAARERVRQEIERDASSWDRRSNEARATELAHKLQRGDAIPDQQQYRQVALTSLAFLDGADIERATQRIFPLDSMSLLVVSAEESARVEAVRTQVATARRLDAKRVAGAAPLPPEVPLFGPIEGAGAVTALVHNSDTRVTTATLKGGVIVHHKPMDPGRGRVVIAAGLALPTLTDDPVARAELRAISSLGWQPALADHPSSRVMPALERRDVDLDVKVYPESIVFEISAPREQFEFAMQTLHGMLESPRVEAGAIDRWRASALQDDASARTEPSRAALRVFEQRVAPEFGRRAGGLDLEAVQRVNAAAVQARLDSILREPALTVAIAGDLDRPRALQVSAALFSGMTSQLRTADGVGMDRCALPMKGPTEVRLQQPLASGSAAVVIGFFGPDASDASDAVALDVAASILEDKLRERFKKERFSGAAVGVWSIEGEAIEGAGRFWVRAIVEPGSADAVAAMIREEMDLLREDGPDKVQLLRASERAANAWERYGTSANAWADALARNEVLAGMPLRALLDRATAAKQLTTPSVRAALQEYDTLDRSFRIIVLPGEPGRVE